MPIPFPPPGEATISSQTTGRFDASTSRSQFLDRSHFSGLDGLRGVAIIAVIWHHTTWPGSWLPMASRGFLGVDLFFVLSGFLIVTLLLREQDRTSSIDLGRFYARRALRIFPLYYGILLALLALSLVAPADSSTMMALRENRWYHLAYLSNWFGTESILAVTWSLAAEEQFYLFWPPLQRFARRAAIPFLLAFLAGNQLVNFGVLFADSRSDHAMLEVTFTPVCLGVGLAYLLHRGPSQVHALLASRWLLPGSLAILLVIVNLPSAETSLVGIQRLTIHVLMTVIVGAIVVGENNPLAPLLRSRPLARIGVISYGIYLLHIFVVHVAMQATSRLGLTEVPFLLFVAVLIGSTAAAEVSFRLLESPILGLKRRLEPREGAARSSIVLHETIDLNGEQATSSVIHRSGALGREIDRSS